MVLEGIEAQWKVSQAAGAGAGRASFGTRGAEAQWEVEHGKAYSLVGDTKYAMQF